VAAKNHAHGAANPNAALFGRAPPSVEEVLAAPPLAPPITVRWLARE
jgi:acetyl-CoA acetyltransferase